MYFSWIDIINAFSNGIWFAQSKIIIEIVATTVTILTQDLNYLSLNLLPIGGIIVGIATEVFLEYQQKEIFTIKGGKIVD